MALSDAFLAVQRRFVERQRRGALLCLVSRNVEEDVRAARLELHCLELLFLDLSRPFLEPSRQVLRERRDELLLRDEHVVAIRAAPDMRKSSGLAEIYPRSTMPVELPT